MPKNNSIIVHRSDKALCVSIERAHYAADGDVTQAMCGRDLFHVVEVVMVAVLVKSKGGVEKDQ